MGYSFQLVPLQEFEQHRRRLSQLPPAFDRASALPVGACALLLQDAAQRCLAGMAEEKRLLAIWVRQGRMGVRLIRGKGSSNERAWANAALSNAADQARNTLDRLALEAPRALEQVRQRLQDTGRFINDQEARAFIPAYLQGVRASERARTTRGLCLVLYVSGGVLLFVVPLLGLLLLALAALVQVCNRADWQAVDRAEAVRQRQHQEIREDAAEGQAFLERLEQADSARDPELDQAAVAAIAADLRRSHVYLEVACRELGSQALSWEQLAEEILPAQQLAGDGLAVPPRLVPPAIPPLPPPVQAPAPTSTAPASTAPASTTAVSTAAVSAGAVSTAQELLATARAVPLQPSHRPVAAPLAIPLRHEAGSYQFGLDLQGAQEILRRLGYRRLPRRWQGISARAEQRICTYLAALVPVDMEAFRWRFEEGSVRAEALAEGESA